MLNPASSMRHALTPRSIELRAFRVPLNIALGTSVAVMKSVPLLLVDVLMEEGPVGRSYVFCYSASGAKAVAGHMHEAFSLVAGKPASPLAVYGLLSRRFALLGVTGTVRAAISALDMALWDAAAVAAGQPLFQLLGAERRPIPAYDSRGLGLMTPDEIVSELEAMLAKGLKAVKLRLGYPTLEADLLALQTVQSRVPAGVKVMVDYNQALTKAEAIRRGLRLQERGIEWLEEPIRHDDYRGYAEMARELHVPIQIGENFNGPEAMSDALALSAADYVMPDPARIGGVSGWLAAAGIAAAGGIEMSSHLMPELCIHLLSASPTAHWLEYVDWADAILEQPLELTDGAAIAPDRPGFGLSWNEEKLRRLDAI